MNANLATSPWKVLGLLAAFAIGAAGAARAADTPLTPSAPGPAASGIDAARQKIDSGDYRGAMPLLTAVIKGEPRNADALNLMGYSLRKTGQTTQALEYYNAALGVMPRHLGANEYLGELYVELGQIDKAKERLAVLQAACGDNCEQTRDLAGFIAKAAARK